MRVVQRSENTALLAKAPQQQIVGGAAADHLDGDALRELATCALSEVHGPHPAVAQLSNQRPRSEPFSDQGRWRRAYRVGGSDGGPRHGQGRRLEAVAGLRHRFDQGQHVLAQTVVGAAGLRHERRAIGERLIPGVSRDDLDALPELLVHGCHRRETRRPAASGLTDPTRRARRGAPGAASPSPAPIHA